MLSRGPSNTYMCYRLFIIVITKRKNRKFNKLFFYYIELFELIKLSLRISIQVEDCAPWGILSIPDLANWLCSFHNDNQGWLLY